MYTTSLRPLTMLLLLLLLFAGTCRCLQEYDSYHQTVQVPGMLFQPVLVQYKHRDLQRHIVDVEQFWIGLTKLEELDGTGNTIKTYQTHKSFTSCTSSSFKPRQTLSLTTREEEASVSLRERFSYPEEMELQSNRTDTGCNPEDYPSTLISRSVQVYRVPRHYGSQRLCHPDCSTSTLQTPVFNETIRLGFNISNWRFCDKEQVSCADKVGKFLRLTLSFMYISPLEEVRSERNDAKFEHVSNHTAYCKTQYNRYRRTFREGYFTSLANQTDQPVLQDLHTLNKICHNFTYLGYHGIGDDYRQIKLITTKNRLSLRPSEHVLTGPTHDPLSLTSGTPGLQGPLIHGGNELRVVLPAVTSSLYYDVMMEVDSGTRGLVMGVSVVLMWVLVWC